jgi:membrane associated rhomboid family serine protease
MRRPPPISEFPHFPVTAGTVLLAIGVTIAYWSKVDISPLIEDANVRRWQLWRCLSSALPHGSPLHLIFNVYWTWTFGSLVEEVFGSFKTLLIFVLLALGSGAADYALAEGGIGLSGVGYGLFGMLWMLKRRDARFEGVVDHNTTSLFVVWFFICIILTATGAMAVANVAHGAGALLGASLGWSIAERGRRRAGAVAALVLLIGAAVTGATALRPWVNLAREGYHGEFELGYAALQKGDPKEAVRWFRDVTRMAPRVHEAWFDLGIAYQRLNRMNGAAAAFERAYRLRPNEKDYREMWEYSRAATQPGRHAEEQGVVPFPQRFFDKK